MYSPSSTDSAPTSALPSPPHCSTVEFNLSALSFDFFSLPALQSACPSVQSMLPSPSLSVVFIPFLHFFVLCNESFGTPCPLVPAALRHHLFLSLSGISHLGVCESQRLLSSWFVWPGLNKNVGLWTRSCLRCQSARSRYMFVLRFRVFLLPGGGFLIPGSGGSSSL